MGVFDLVVENWTRRRRSSRQIFVGGYLQGIHSYISRRSVVAIAYPLGDALRTKIAHRATATESANMQK
jgi:hypothetical protein